MSQAYAFNQMPQQMMQQMGMPSLLSQPNGAMNSGANGNAQQDVEILEVPNNTVGLIIGKGGEQISKIQTTSGCRVQMSPDHDSNNGVRQCTLSGPRMNIDAAKSMILDIIARANERQGERGGQFSNGGGGGGIVVNIAVPPNRAGLVIGKGGEVIKNLQERTGARMNMIQDSANDQGNKNIRIQGDPAKVEAARRLVEEIIATGQAPRLGGGQMNGGQFGGAPGSYMGGGGGGTQVGEVIVPRSAVGMIIGKSGENIKRMAAESGARIQFKPDDPSLQDRVCIVQGSIDAINRATVMITQCVTKSEGGGSGLMGASDQQTFYMHVPATKCGLVIGRQGETIKQINSESQAHVELQRDTANNPNEKVFTIKGTPYQIHVATHLIRIKVGDIPQGTPVPPYPGAQDAQQMGGQFPTINQFQPQPAQQGFPGGQAYGGQPGDNAWGDNAWGQYYGQRLRVFGVKET